MAFITDLRDLLNDLRITKVKGRSAENVSFSFQFIKNLVSTCGPFIFIDPASGNLDLKYLKTSLLAITS